MTTAPTETIEAAARQFAEDGFVVLPNALSAREIEDLNAAFADHQRAHPDDWAHFSPSFIQTADVLPDTAAFDGAIENPQVLPLLTKLFGEKLAFEELSLMIRNPTETTGELKGWHRDIIRDFDRRREIDAISVVYYLSDVTEQDHCFSIIPGTHDRLVDVRPEVIETGMEVDAIGPAGSAFVFHARCIHAGKLKLGSAQRRTMHLYFGRYGEPRTSEWSQIPPRLFMKDDPSLPPYLYAKAHVHQIVDGTGRKPRDVDPGTSAAQMLLHLQRQANRAAPQAG